MFPLLETNRLILREIAKNDAEALFAGFSNDEVLQYYGQEAMKTMEEAEAFVDFFTKSYQEKKGIRWGIQRKETEHIIGTIGFNAWMPKHRRAEIGYELQPDFWGKGYAYEAVQAVTNYGFHNLGLTRIGAVVFKENKASYQLLSKIGFQREGVLRDYMFQNGKPYDTYVYSLLKY